MILASLSEDERVKIFRRIKLDKVTGNTLTTQTRLLTDLKAGLQRGYQITRGENVADVMALAAPLKLETLSLGVAIAGPVQRIEKAKNKLAKALLKTTKGLVDSYE